MEFTVEQSEIGTRIDKIIIAPKTPYTRSHIQKLIKLGLVLVNGKVTNTHYALKEGDRIVINEEEKPAQLPTPIMEVLFENDEYAIINKPTGIIVHAAAHSTTSTLVDQLLKKWPSMAKVGDDPSRPGIVHRLDKDVSGVMVVAKTQDSFEWLKRQFKLRKTEKQYVALVNGVLPRKEGTISFSLARAKRVKVKMAPSKDGKDAITHFEVLAEGHNYSLLLVQPQTGRMHQIRVHLHAYGHQIVGDRIYRSKSTPNPEGIRLMLHALNLSFYDSKGVWQQYHSTPDSAYIQAFSTLTELEEIPAILKG